MHRDGGGYPPAILRSGAGMPARRDSHRHRGRATRCVMIAAVNGRAAARAALLLCAVRWGWAADDAAGAARELARKTVAFAGRGEPVAVSWKNLSGLGAAELAQARTAFETGLRDAGTRTTESGPVEARVSISENPSQYLMVEEVRKAEERQVWIAAWRRTAAAAGP